MSLVPAGCVGICANSRGVSGPGGTHLVFVDYDHRVKRVIACEAEDPLELVECRLDGARQNIDTVISNLPEGTASGVRL